MSPCRNWDSPTPSHAKECAPPPGTKGGEAHSAAGEGLEESQFRRLEKSLALCLLCDYSHPLSLKSQRFSISNRQQICRPVHMTLHVIGI
jgi:hypothetical protein